MACGPSLRVKQRERGREGPKPGLSCSREGDGDPDAWGHLWSRAVPEDPLSAASYFQVCGVHSAAPIRGYWILQAWLALLWARAQAVLRICVAVYSKALSPGQDD